MDRQDSDGADGGDQEKDSDGGLEVGDRGVPFVTSFLINEKIRDDQSPIEEKYEPMDSESAMAPTEEIRRKTGDEGLEVGAGAFAAFRSSLDCVLASSSLRVRVFHLRPMFQLCSRTNRLPHGPCACAQVAPPSPRPCNDRLAVACIHELC
ncbi:hypothetical protein LXL04_020760 [Taraxacum kok-saghyz]